MPRHNPYHYSFNSPLVWKDPSGLAPEKEQDRLMGIYTFEVEQAEEAHTNMTFEIMSRSFAALMYDSYFRSLGLNAFRDSDGHFHNYKYVGGGGRTGEDGNGENGKKTLRLGYSYWSDGMFFSREIWVEDDDGRFSYCESGSILDGQEFVDLREFKVETRDGVDPDTWLTGIQTSLDAYGLIDQGMGGAVAGILSAAIDLYRGNYFDAGMGLLSAVPIIGIAGDLYKANKIAKAANKAGKELFKFGETAAQHMTEPGRRVPIQIMDDVIKTTKGLPDPEGSRALMYNSPMWRNGKLYQLEILYDKKSNSIWHFQYNPIKP